MPNKFPFTKIGRILPENIYGKNGKKMEKMEKKWKKWKKNGKNGKKMENSL